MLGFYFIYYLTCLTCRCRLDFFFSFLFFEKKVKILYYGKSNWKTSFKFGGRYSNHTSVSADEIARQARAWVNLLPLRLTCKKLQKIEEDKKRISSIACLYVVRNRFRSLLHICIFFDCYLSASISSVREFSWEISSYFALKICVVCPKHTCKCTEWQI